MLCGAALSREPERLAFFAFDLLMLDGRDLRNEPLHERRRLLQDLVGSTNPAAVRVQSRGARHRPGGVRCCRRHMGLEGIVSKNVNSPYRSGTSLRWLKTKAFGEAEFHIMA
jgi:bifunctional non-homologous end joining protein LigD